jgi:hypothetical protein
MTDFLLQRFPLLLFRFAGCSAEMKKNRETSAYFFQIYIFWIHKLFVKEWNITKHDRGQRLLNELGSWIT